VKTSQCLHVVLYFVESSSLRHQSPTKLLYDPRLRCYVFAQFTIVVVYFIMSVIFSLAVFDVYLFTYACAKARFAVVLIELCRTSEFIQFCNAEYGGKKRRLRHHVRNICKKYLNIYAHYCVTE